MAIARLLLEADADVETRSRWCGITPLLAACAEGREQVVRVLLEGGANKEARDRRGSTPLLVAAHCFCPEIVCLLLEANAERTVRNSYGETPLWVAINKDSFQHAKRRQEEVVCHLLRRVADPNCRVQGQNYPLHMACRRGHVRIAKLLLQARADQQLSSD